ncbi:hypothetical protein ONZ43_g4423 [Nemania bipapillata]|uniref:Uncharacterized protein n=1 Tax=Nemania bipapillata TaxID=110536 RepID=A0ACC2IMT4_9PEZI|nr:hypothetical protein ONZ43_g4423 [Nemania bipapillata]
MDILEEYRSFGGLDMLLPSLNDDCHIQAVILALVVYCGPSIIQLDIPSGHIRYTLLAIAFFFGPSTSTLNALSEPYFRWILLAVAVLAAVISLTMNVAGPLRYGYPRYKIFYAKLCGLCPNWAHPLLLILALHPWTSWWLLGMTLTVSWHYVREQHREKVAEITDSAEKACIRASSLVSLSQAESVAAKECWKTAQSLASNIARDARAAHHVRLTDFYTESAAAWSKLDDYTRAVGKVAEDAKTLNGITSSLQDKAEKIAKNATDYKQERGRILNVAEQCTEVFTHVLDLQRDGERIRDKAERFRRAADKATKGREMQVIAAEEAVQVIAAITGEVNSATVEAGFVTGYADEVRQLAIDAKTAIAVGSEENAVAALEKIRVTLAASEQKWAAVVQARQNVQARMGQFSVVKVLNIVADPDPLGEDLPDEEGGDEEEENDSGEDR